MKMIMAVFMIRLITSWIDNKTKENKDAIDPDPLKTQHPAEFRIR